MERIEYPDLMVDIETTGLQPSRSAIIQIGAVPFNFHTGDIDAKNMFKVALSMPMKRCWTDNTEKFWKVDNAEVYAQIMASAQPWREGFMSFYRYACLQENARFWCKGLNFDWNFIEEYCRDLDLDMPFNFRQAKDLRSFIAGMNGEALFEDPYVERVGNHHDALSDCLTQLKQLLKTKAETCQSSVVSN